MTRPPPTRRPRRARPRRPPALVASLAALLAAAAPAASAGGEPVPDGHVRIPGTRVHLAVPEGFAVAEDFPGIGRDEDVTSVLVTELPVPLEVASRSLEPDALEQRGVALHASARVEADGRDALLAHASQRTAGTAFRKWMLLFGDSRGSVLVTATTPREYEERHQEALVDTLRSVVWRPDDGPDDGPDDASDGPAAPDALPFALRAPPPFEVVSRASNAVVLTDRERAAAGGVAPLVSVGASLGRVAVGDLADFARRRLDETPSVEAIEAESEGARTLGGMPGHEIRARARDVQTGREVRVVQLLAAREGRYYLVQAIARPADAAATRSAYEAVAESFRLR